MTKEENSMEQFKEICKADGEKLAKHFEEELPKCYILNMIKNENRQWAQDAEWRSGTKR